MKKTNLFNAAFSLLFVVVLFNAVSFAQSTDPDNPTVLTSNQIQGKNIGDKTLTYYYTFTAGPGIVKFTADIKANINSTDMEWKLLDVNFKELDRDLFNGEGTGARKIKEVALTKKQKVILRVDVGTNAESFKIRLDGAVNFSGNNSDENIPDISSSDDNQTPQQICMPRNGILILTMQDGKKAKVDLSKVKKIEIQ